MHLYVIYNRNMTCLSYQYLYLYCLINIHIYIISISTVDILLFSNTSIILSLD